MTYKEYKDLFDDILKDRHPQSPYDKETYHTYAKLGKSRMNRWDKQLRLDEELVKLIENIKTPQHWIMITEPWCGDAGQLLPFLIKMTTLNSHITYDIQLRDTEPFLIESYLTNSTRSIPKLIVRDDQGKDLFTWGPRPKGARDLLLYLKSVDENYEVIKISLQKWYNQDKGVSLCKEILLLLSENSGLSITVTSDPDLN